MLPIDATDNINLVIEDGRASFTNITVCFTKRPLVCQWVVELHRNDRHWKTVAVLDVSSYYIQLTLNLFEIGTKKMITYFITNKWLDEY